MQQDTKFKNTLSSLVLGCTLTTPALAETENMNVSSLEHKTMTIVKADLPQTQYPWVKEFTEVEFGPYKVHVPKGGYYDRYQMNPDLNDVANDPEVGNIDFFKNIPKQQVETRVGTVWSPDYYYRTSNVQLLMLAPIDKLKAKIPDQLEPLSVLPGYGLVSLTFFAYDVCDNDPYDEVSVAVVVRRPDAAGSQLKELIQSIKRRDYYGYVLALPVDTEIARVRGVYGYSLPKWLTAIDLNITDRIQANLYDTQGKIDVSLSAKTPKFKTVSNQSRLEKKTMLNQVDGIWYSSYVQANNLTFHQDFFPRDVTLIRNGGPVSKLLDQLGAQKILRMDVVKDTQLALHMPKPIDAWNKQNSTE